MTELKPKEYKLQCRGREFSLEYGQFIALEYYDKEGQKRRLYGRVTDTMINDAHFRFMLGTDLYDIVTDLTIEEKEHIYNTCQ